PVGYSVYFATDKGNDVYMGTQYLATATSKSLVDFRDKQFLKLNEPAVKEYSFNTKDVQAVFSHESGKYAFVSPDKFATDSDAVEMTISDMIRAKTTQFIDAPTTAQQEQFSAKKRLAELAWKMTDGSQVTLTFAEIDKKVWATTDPKTRLELVPDDLKPKILD